MACLVCLPQPAKSAFVFYVWKNFFLRIFFSFWDSWFLSIWYQIGIAQDTWSWMFDICFKCIGIHKKLFVFSWFPVSGIFRNFSFFIYRMVFALSLLRTLQYLLKSCYPTQVIHCLKGQLLLLWPTWYVIVRTEEFGTLDHTLGAKFLSMLTTQLHKISNGILTDIYSSVCKLAF